MSVSDIDRVLQRQGTQLDSIKHIMIGLERADRGQRNSGIDLGAAVIRSLVCRFKSFNRTGSVEDMCARLYGKLGAEGNRVRQALVDLPGLVLRAVTNPAATGT